MMDFLLFNQQQSDGCLTYCFVRQGADRKQLIVVLWDEIRVDSCCLKLRMASQIHQELDVGVESEHLENPDNGKQ